MTADAEPREDADDDDEEVELHPPAAARVAQRALVLAACACRASLEEAPGHPIARQTWTDLQSWIATVGIRDELEPHEADALAVPLGKLSERQRVDMSWRSEGMAVLGWALCRCELPRYDLQVDGPPLAHALGFLIPDADGLLASAMLRPAVELEQLADSLLTLHWRLRQQRLHPEALDFVAFARKCQWATMRLDGLQLLDADLALRGVSVSEADPPLLAECTSIAQERHQAANWLVGTEILYSDVTTDT